MSLDLDDIEYGIANDDDQVIALFASKKIAEQMAAGYPLPVRVVELYKNDNTKANVEWEF